MPLTTEQYERSLAEPPLCEQLRVRDLIDNLLIQTNGSFVAGYRIGGICSYYASDEERNRTKLLLEALLRSLPERSMRLQVRFEISEGASDLIARYSRELRSQNPIMEAFDREQTNVWARKEAAGHYLDHALHFYFIWDPRIHHQSPGFELKQSMRAPHFSMSVKKCIERSRQEHEELVAEFNSLMCGVEGSLQTIGMKVERMSDQELFREIKRALSPRFSDTRPYQVPAQCLAYESARSQIANVNIEDEVDDHLKIGGLLYSLISLKDLPDSTFPGLLRELLVLDFPLVINSEIVLPDQTKAVKQYKSRLRKMTAAQKDMYGGFRLNVDAQVAEQQLTKVLQELIGGSLKSCQLSFTVAVRTSRPVRNRSELLEAERVLADRRQRVLQATARMNGARAIAETLAQKRLFFSSLPALGGINKREQDVLTLHAADLLPIETPWRGTPNAPLMLFETPYRHLIPFSPFDASLGDANLLIMAKTGGGKTFLAQLMLLMISRARPLVSILERGDSYARLVELMRGRIIQVQLDGRETLNPWDLPVGETEPSNEKTAFLKNLTRHMLGETKASDSALLDNVLTEAITRVYKRCAIRSSNPTPTFNDLREELANWRDAERLQRTLDEAHLAAIKLRQWTESGVYAKLFDRHTNMRLDSDWLFFNVEGLSADPRLETAMSMLIAAAMSSRAASPSSRPSIAVLDECWFLLDSPALAPEVVQLYRTARKRNSSVWGISQTIEDFVGPEANPRPHGPGILKNASTKIVGQQPGDLTPLVRHLNLNRVAIHEVKGFAAPRKGRGAEALLVVGEKAETTETISIRPTPLAYWVCTTFPRERKYRDWFLKQRADRPLLEGYQELSRRFPEGLAELVPLPEEISAAER